MYSQVYSNLNLGYFDITDSVFRQYGKGLLDLGQDITRIHALWGYINGESENPEADSQKTAIADRPQPPKERPELRPKPIGILAVPHLYDHRSRAPPPFSGHLPENRLQAPLRPPPIGVLPHPMALPEFQPLAPVVTSVPPRLPQAAPNAEATLEAAVASSAARRRRHR